MGDRIFAIDDQTFLFPDQVRDAYLADIQAKIDAGVVSAVAGMPDVVNAVTTKVATLTSDTAVAPLLDTATTTRGKLDARYVLYAPAPTGNATTDQNNLTPLFAASQTTGMPVQLRPGTYVGNWVLNQTYEQPIIRGAGKHLTRIQAAVSTTPIFKFRGGSGAISGGRLENLTLTPASGSGGNAVELSGCGGVQVRNVRFQTGFIVCGLFHNEAGNDFTEYNVFEDCEFYLSAGGYAAVYQVDNGVESFHGSGLRGLNVINVAAGFDGPAIYIGAGAFPYEAPLEFDIFPGGTANTVIIQNNSGGRQANFYGSIRVEASAPGVVLATGFPVWFAGDVHELGSTGARMGALDLVDKVTYNDSIVYASKKKKAFITTLGNGTSMVMPVNGSNGERLLGDNTSALAQLTLYGTNYHYVYQLLLFQSPYDASGNVSVQNTPLAINNAGYGAATLGWANGLTVRNASFPTSGSGQVKAFVEAIPFGFPINTNVLAQ